MVLKSVEEVVYGLKRYYRLYGFYGIILRTVRRVKDWFIKSEYLFRVDLGQGNFDINSNNDLSIDSFCSLKDISTYDLDRLEVLMGLGRSKPFLEHFFAYGAKLWIARINGEIVGLCWTLQGGFSGFYCMPMENDDVLYLAVQVFHEFKGKNIWKNFFLANLSELQKEGISRLYFGVHPRNKAMLRAVQKAKVELVGRVLSMNFLGWHISFWRKRYLWGRQRSFQK